jgi:hypothetical protein
MPLYGWSGPGKMREMDLARTKAPEIVMPTTVSLVKEPVKVFKCTECGKKFKKAMIVARHFNSAHSELKEDKDSWRLYVEEVKG